MIKVIGFDLDNTLYNQELFEFEIFRQISTIVAENFKIDDSQYLKTLIALSVRLKFWRITKKTLETN